MVRDLVIVKYFPAEMVTKWVIETRANRNIMKAWAWHPAKPNGHSFWKCLAMDNGIAIAQERKSLTAILRIRYVGAEMRRWMFLQIVKITTPLKVIPKRHTTNSITTNNVFHFWMIFMSWVPRLETVFSLTKSKVVPDYQNGCSLPSFFALKLPKPRRRKLISIFLVCSAELSLFCYVMFDLLFIRIIRKL